MCPAMFFFSEADLRVSDADRDAAVDFLNRHYASGRLSDEELSARVDAVYRARFDSQLDALTHDLPELAPATLQRAPRPWGGALALGAAGAGAIALATVVPPEAWALLLGLALPVLMMLLFTVAPLALPLLAFAWLAPGLGGGRSGLWQLDERPRHRIPRRL